MSENKIEMKMSESKLPSNNVTKYSSLIVKAEIARAGLAVNYPALSLSYPYLTRDRCC
jgi:hypothetical protein